MSHEATNWAIRQRGLKPATKLVLWHLCDRHNPDHGCFPSQARLAHDAEVSRASLNEHLNLLEQAGLLRRERCHDPVTKRRMSTRYILGFEDGFTAISTDPCPESGHGAAAIADDVTSSKKTNDISPDKAVPCPDSGHGNRGEAMSRFPAEPCPDFGESHVQNLDTNLVREPLRETVTTGACARASDDALVFDLKRILGIAEDGPISIWWISPNPQHHVQHWRNDLGLTDAHILDVARRLRSKFTTPPDGPKALDRAMEQAARQAPNITSTKMGAGRFQFMADWINGDLFLPPSAVTNDMALKLLALKLVTPERLRERTGMAFDPQRVSAHA